MRTRIDRRPLRRSRRPPLSIAGHKSFQPIDDQPAFVYPADYVRRLRPRLSIVLIDWSARESFHSLKYLGKQTVGRDWYELIWVEFYSTRKAMYHDADRYVIMGMPKTVCYHKHLMYNVGIFQARGDVVCFAIRTPVYKTPSLPRYSGNSTKTRT